MAKADFPSEPCASVLLMQSCICSKVDLCFYLLTCSSDDMVTKRRHSKNFPSPEYCILDMVNAHLKMNREGRKLTRGVLV